jgi:hypothetical protein
VKFSGRIFSVAAYFVLAVSLLASALGFFSDIDGLFVYFLWVHIAIILLAWWAIRTIRKRKLYRADLLRTFLSRSKTLLVLSLLVIVMAALAMRSIGSGLGEMPDGTVVHQKSWFERDGRYWLSTNGQEPVEITQSQYRRTEQKTFTFFSLLWVISSSILACAWAFIAHAEMALAAEATDPPV